MSLVQMFKVSLVQMFKENVIIISTDVQYI